MSSFTQSDYFTTPSFERLESSSSSSASTTSSTYSRSSEGVFDRLVMQSPYTHIDLWSAGNVRMDGRDLTLPAEEAMKLMEALAQDSRFKLVDCVMYDAEGDWKMTYNRTTIATPTGSSAGSDYDAQA